MSATHDLDIDDTSIEHLASLAPGRDSVPQGDDNLGWAQFWAREANGIVQERDYTTRVGVEDLTAMISMATLHARIAEVKLQASIVNENEGEWS